MLEPYPHQVRAKHELYKSIKDNEKSIAYVAMPCGSGKALLAAMICKDVLSKGKRVIQCVPRRELVVSNYEETVNYVGSEGVGKVCLQTKDLDVNAQCIVGMITTLVSRIDEIGAVSCLIIDECHLVSHKDDSYYRTLVRTLQERNPNLRVFGLTGTPFRYKEGYLHTGTNALFTTCALDLTTEIRDFVAKGLLTPLVTLNENIRIDTSKLTIQNGEYKEAEQNVAFADILPSAVLDMKQHFATHNIETALIFCVSIANAIQVVEEFNEDCIKVVHGEIGSTEREELIDWFTKSTGRRYLVNVNLLTTGFNYKALQCVVMLRATVSIALYVQCVSRAIRKHENKKCGYVIDYGTNVARHGAIDSLKLKITERLSKDTDLNLQEEFRLNVAAALDSAAKEGGNFSLNSESILIKAKDVVVVINPRVHVDLHVKQDTGRQSIKISYFSNYKLLANQFLSLDYTSFARKKSLHFLQQLLVDKDDIDTLAEITAKEFVTLFNEDIARKLFAEILAVKIRKQDDSKYFDVEEVIT